MTEVRRSDTIVIQTFRTREIANWIQRCLDSVRNWAKLHGHDYALAGDEFFQLCGPEYLARGNKNPRTITNLARLIATRNHLNEGYRRVIWMDADTFVFDPVNLVFDFPDQSLPTGYAFGREVWVYRDAQGVMHIKRPATHNAATYFTDRAVDLDMLIALIRHIDAQREIVSNFQVGVRLLRGLHYSLMFPTFSHVAMFSLELIQAIAEDDGRILRAYGLVYRYPAFAGNFGLSLQDAGSESVLARAIERLEETKGNVLNRYAKEKGVHLIPYDSYARDGERLFAIPPKSMVREILRPIVRRIRK